MYGLFPKILYELNSLLKLMILLNVFKIYLSSSFLTVLLSLSDIHPFGFDSSIICLKLILLFLKLILNTNSHYQPDTLSFVFLFYHICIYTTYIFTLYIPHAL